jgi:hypothetical protein
MKKVVCINDRKLPEGAEVVNGREYRVINEFINSYDQRVFIISGIRNKGTTKNGLMWHGYSSSRFADLDLISIGNVEYSEELSNQ